MSDNALPPNWVEQKSHGKVFYYNKKTKKRQWTKPEPEGAPEPVVDNSAAEGDQLIAHFQSV